MISSDYIKDKILEIENIQGNLIRSRISEFKRLKKSDKYTLFKELSFCILTANTSAELGLKCQAYINDGFYRLDYNDLREELIKVHYRFYNKRASYIIGARDIIDDLEYIVNMDDHFRAREILIERVKGIGYKEASHFLRNVGIFDFAILDKHIIKFMKNNYYIKYENNSSRRRYLENEIVFNELAKKFNMEPGVFDLYIWYIETGKILK
ncbi:N-glycosylase/DNA lyase [Picrophilus oshimae]|uniref:8-oxoguanine DNA glycosylase/AP lyase n=1 Tax=Picrophilus torridus (strain ATCC 700027 / DSM 9790 / JCM 10055 / NBRC 100828 / KAW 2/3) TaxID=1122961 RepID=A0A8G2L725_PICTO|nr:N-glycosylase/DNA lyase [Picrophilus oshimae]SMD30627.1 N-glycosylase/DNA lyase [Picrophilus oshimae DSM 9789]